LGGMGASPLERQGLYLLHCRIADRPPCWRPAEQASAKCGCSTLARRAP